jgi:uncharacterized protein YxjI
MNENCKQLWKILESLKEKKDGYTNAIKIAKEEHDFSKMKHLMEGLKSTIAEAKGILQLESLKLEQQYSQMVKTLDHYEINKEGMPTLESIKKALVSSMDTVRKTRQLHEPVLIIIPPTSRQSKVEEMDDHKVKGQEGNTFTYEFDDDNLWNGGVSEDDEKIKKWRVKIVEGIQGVPQDSEIHDGKKRNSEMTKEWVKKLEGKGLEVMNDADSYLTLMMRTLVDGTPIDSETYTVLNGKNLTSHSHISYGYLFNGRVNLDLDDADDVYDNLCLRGSVCVNIQ